MLNIIRFLILIPISVFLLSSCSIFQKSKKIDMSPFADNAGTLFSEATKVSRPFQWKHLKPYLNIEEFQSAVRQATPLFEALRGVVYYSNQVVAINNSKFSDREKNHQLSKFILEALQKSIKNQKLDSLQLDEKAAREVIEHIRNSKTYLDGISAASPIVNSVVVAIQKRLDRVQAMIDPITLALDREIENDYGATRYNYDRLVDLQEQLMLSVTRIFRARIGDTAELDTLLQENVSLRKYLPSSKDAIPEQLMAAELHLRDQLQHIEVMFNQLVDIKGAYIVKQNELVAWRSVVEEKIMVARTAMTIWAQSHRNLGAGIPVPPLFDVGGFATSLVGTAAGTVIP